MLKFICCFHRPLHLACSSATFKTAEVCVYCSIDSDFQIAQLPLLPPSSGLAWRQWWRGAPLCCWMRISLLCAFRRRLWAWSGGGGGGEHCWTRTSLLCAFRRRPRVWPESGGGGRNFARGHPSATYLGAGRAQRMQTTLLTALGELAGLE